MSTMLYDAHDAHMSDYPIDIDMSLSSEPWFDPENTMQDDDSLAPVYDNESTHSVEVEMGDDHYTEEYEMFDGKGEEGHYEEMGGELVDIEVVDFTEEEPTLDATLLPVDVDAEVALESLTSGGELSLEPEGVGLVGGDVVVSLNPSISPGPPDADLPDASAQATPIGIFRNLGEPHVEEASTAPSETAITQTGEETESSASYRDAVAEGESAGDDGLAGTFHAGDALQLPESLTSDDKVEHESGTSEAPIDVPSEEHESAEAVHSEPDPHEISEGVYIDPPPAVLLSFEDSSFPDMTLFNRPTRSRSASPTPTTPGAHILNVLLHHQPILYYESLSSVFEALRQEESISQMLDLADSELILDAYDLQLTVSEDNVHTREVTLHDLNVLHDGSNLVGPLRLRLKVVAPRFIRRFRMLQDRISRLQLGFDEEHEPDGDPVEYVEPDATEPFSGGHEDDNPVASQESFDPHTVLAAPSEQAQPNADEGAEEVYEEAADEEEYNGETLNDEEVDQPSFEETVEEVTEDDGTCVEQPVEDSTQAAQEEYPDSTDTRVSPDHGKETSDKYKPDSSNTRTATPDAEVPIDGTNDGLESDQDPAQSDPAWVALGDEEQDADTTLAGEAEHETASNKSSVTLSSKTSKRSFDEVGFEEEETDPASPPGSPGTKRKRLD